MKNCDSSKKFFVSCQDMGIKEDLGLAATAHKNFRKIRSVTSPFVPEIQIEIQNFDPKSSQKLEINLQILKKIAKTQPKLNFKSKKATNSFDLYMRFLPTCFHWLVAATLKTLSSIYKRVVLNEAQV